MNDSNDELKKLESKLQSTRLQGGMDDDAHGQSLLLSSLLENAKIALENGESFRV